MKRTSLILAALTASACTLQASATPVTLPWVESTAWGTPQAVLVQPEINGDPEDPFSSWGWEDTVNVAGSVGVSKWNPALGQLLDVRVDSIGSASYAWDITINGITSDFFVGFDAQIGLASTDPLWDHDSPVVGAEYNLVPPDDSDSGTLELSFSESVGFSSSSAIDDFTGPGIYSVNLTGFTQTYGGTIYGHNGSFSGGMSGIYSGFLFVRYLFEVDPNASYINPATGDVYNGDANLDGFVGLDDLDAVLNNWNLDGSVEGRTIGYNEGDLDGDNFVGLDDMDIVLNNWGAGTPPAASTSIPEPATLGLLSFAAALGLTRRH